MLVISVGIQNMFVSPTLISSFNDLQKFVITDSTNIFLEGTRISGKKVPEGYLAGSGKDGYAKNVS